MQVIAYRGKVLFPLTWDPTQLAQLTGRTLVNHKGKTVNIFRKEEFSMEEMRCGIGELLNGTPDKSIAAIYSFDRREVLDLPRVNQRVRFRPRSGEESSILLGQVQFVLFDSGVCFLCVDVQMEDASLETVMNTTYYLCEIKDRANRIAFEKFTFDPQTKTKTAETVELSVKDLLLRCAAFLPECGHFEDRPLESAVAKPLLYSYYLLQEKPQDFAALASNIGQNYKLSYKGLEDEAHLLPTFQNSAWCASSNGAANLTYEVEDASTNAFFRTTFPHKWETEYLFLFLNVIHQKYAALKYLDALALCAGEHRGYDAMKQMLAYSEEMQERCEKQKMRCFFDMPSRIGHVNKVYGFFRTTMQIPSYIGGLNRKLREAVSVCGSYTGRIDQIEDKEKEVRSLMTEIKLALLAACITCLTFFNSFYGTLQCLLRGDLSAIGLDAVIMAVTFLAAITTALVNLARDWSKIKSLRSDIRELKEKVGTAAPKA